MIQDQFKFESVMLIDDTHVDRYISMYTMKKHNFAKNILEFDMATKALEYLKENINNPEMLPQIILLDVRMPEMDGFEFLDNLKDFNIDKRCCCIIMISSSLSPHDHERAEKHQIVRNFMNKPLNKEKLDEIVNIFVSE